MFDSEGGTPLSMFVLQYMIRYGYHWQAQFLSWS